MPESKVRKEAKNKARKKKSEELEKARKERRDRKRLAANTERRWVPWVFIPVGLLGVLWIVTWNLAGIHRRLKSGKNTRESRSSVSAGPLPT